MLDDLAINMMLITKMAKLELPRKYYQPLIAQRLVSVQPLSGPTGLVYYLRYRYAPNSKNGLAVDKKKSIMDIIRKHTKRMQGNE